jgi:hypothetical protein
VGLEFHIAGRLRPQQRRQLVPAPSPRTAAAAESNSIAGTLLPPFRYSRNGRCFVGHTVYYSRHSRHPPIINENGEHPASPGCPPSLVDHRRYLLYDVYAVPRL